MKQLLAALGSALLVGGVSSAAFAQVPTFNRDVAPILYNKCAACHRPGEIAPMSLLSYKETRPWARAIKAKVVARQMPPWFAEDNPQHKIKDANVLTQAQIDIVAAWVDGGAPEGPAPAPAPPNYLPNMNAKMNRPADYIIETPDWVDIPATGQIPNFNLWTTKTPFMESTRFFEATELRPLNKAVLHHAAAFARPLPPGTRVGKGPAWKGGPEINGVLLKEDGSLVGDRNNANVQLEETAARAAAQAFSETGPRRPRGGTFNNVVQTYGPAGGFFKTPEGMVRRIGPENPNISWDLHYTGTGKPERARDQVLLWTTDPRKATHEVVASLMADVEIVQGKELFSRNTLVNISDRPNIPPYEENFSVISMTAFDSPVTILNFWPHAHLRGKSIKFVAAFPDGHEEVLLNVPNYQFEWQLFYSLEKPAKLPAGTIVRNEAVYDNSLKNRRNPSPQSEVLWGTMSWEEMHFPWVEFVVDNDVQPWTRRGPGAN